MKILNFEMLKHPLNYVIVGMMVLIAGIALHFVLQFVNGGMPTEKKS